MLKVSSMKLFHLYIVEASIKCVAKSLKCSYALSLLSGVVIPWHIAARIMDEAALLGLGAQADPQAQQQVGSRTNIRNIL